MSKYCRDLNCTFYKIYKKGSKNSNYCPKCGKELVTSKPTEPISMVRVEDNNVTKSVIEVIDPNETKYFAIKFNTLIWKGYWDVIENICLQIGHKYFKNFKACIVAFKHEKKVEYQGNEFIHISGTLRFPHDEIRENRIHFPYRYYLFFKDGSKGEENLFHPNGRNYDRLLNFSIKETSDRNGNFWELFDIMILPDGPNMRHNFLAIAERRYLSFQVLLPLYFYPQNLHLDIFIEDVLLTIDELSKSLTTKFGINDKENILQATQLWESFRTETEQSQVQLVETWLLNSQILDNRLYKKTKDGILLKYLLYQFYLACYLIDDHAIRNEMLTLKLILFIEEHIEAILMIKGELLDAFVVTNDKCKKHNIQNAICNFIFKLVMMNASLRTKVIFLIPIFHKINDSRLQDLNDLDFTKSEYWGFPKTCAIYWQDGIELSTIKKAMKMVDHDQLLLYSILLFTLNEGNVKEFFVIIHPYIQESCLSIFMRALLFRLHETKSNMRELDTMFTLDTMLRYEVITFLDVTLRKEKDTIHSKDINELITLIIVFFTQELPLKFIDEDLFLSVLKLLSHGLSIIALRYPEAPPISIIDSNDLFLNFFCPWYNNNILCNIHDDAVVFKEFEREIKFIDNLMKHIYFPVSIQWSAMMNDFLDNRLKGKEVKPQNLIEIFVLLHNGGKHSKELQGIFHNAILGRIHGASSNDRHKFVVKISETIERTSKPEYLKVIFSEILFVEDTTFREDPISHFINWTSWEIYFELLKSKNIELFLSQKACTALIAASERLQVFIVLMNKLRFTSKEIIQTCGNEDHFLKLVDITLQTKRYSNDTCIPENITLESTRASLQKSKDIIKWVMHEKEQIQILYELFKQCKSINTDVCENFLSQNTDTIPVLDLCDFNDSKYMFRNFPEINLIVYFNDFPQMVEAIRFFQNSVIFVNIFEDHLKNTKHLDAKFDIKQLYNEIWIPSFKSSLKMLQRLYEQDILITEIYELFDGMSNHDKITYELRNFDSGCKVFENKLQEKDRELKMCADKIYFIFKFQKWECSGTAKLIIQLKNGLSMNNNFDLIEFLTDESKNIFGTKRLYEITTDRFKASKDLNYLKENGLDTIRKILEHLNFIKWTMENMKDLNEKKVFVDISLSTHGNDSIAFDIITCFSSVCSNMAPLIFQTNEATTYDILLKYCKEVVANILINNKVIEQLDIVGGNLERLKAMKDCHGSVQKSTLLQLDSIIKSGIFSISLSDSLELTNVLTLTVVEDNKEQRFYNLEQLRELRIKLMLVVGKVEDENIDCYKKSQQFNSCLDILTEMALILIELAESGNQSCLEYKFSYKFDDENDVLHKEIEELSKLIKRWNQEIENARCNHYFLNYFTVSQIVSLSKGISSFLENRDISHVEQLHHLLRIINIYITKEQIRAAIVGSGMNIRNLHNLSQLGYFLEKVFQSSKTKITTGREFPNNFSVRNPNLVTISSSRIFEYILSLYNNDSGLPFPRYHEVLVCSSKTKLEEIDNFWRRTFASYEGNLCYLYILVNIEKLQYDIAVKAVSKFWRYQQDKEKCEVHYKLVLVCTEEEEELSYMATAFEDFKRPNLIEFKPENIKNYLKERFTQRDSNNVSPAWKVDLDHSKVRIVVSESVGAGKSLYIKSLQSNPRVKASVRVAIHGNHAREDQLPSDLLKNNLNNLEHGQLFHIDIASTVHLGLETVLFKLLILGGIHRSNGELWYCRVDDYYIIEITKNCKLFGLANFLNHFPTVQCVQPCESIKLKAENRNTETLHEKELKKEMYMRVCAYLKQLDSGSSLDTFTFSSDSIYSKYQLFDILPIIFKYCGIERPSWREVRNFVSFLNEQLLDCDKSDYCISQSFGEEGFKSFVVKFMIHMSKDFATPSLENDTDMGKDYLSNFQIVERRRWENKPHPYIFFNQDRHTMTFLGFHISKQGHLTDSDDSKRIIEMNIMRPQLFEILSMNMVNLQEVYGDLTKNEKIMKITNVLGIEPLKYLDPDPGYVLTLDNVKKIMAILMRFRCNIPVVIMGETGCGKTRLIQYMCQLQSLHTGTKNMITLKVHGATTEKK